MFDLESRSETRLFDDCLRLGNKIGAKSFVRLASGYQDICNCKQPRMLIFRGDTVGMPEKVASQLNTQLKNWEIKIVDEKTEFLFADVGVIITRSTTPFREEEANLVRKNWRKCFDWYLYLTYTDAIDDEDMEDVQQYVNNAFFQQTEGKRKLKAVYCSLDVCAEVLQKRIPTSRYRAMFACRDIRNAILDMQAKTISSLEKIEKNLVELRANELAKQDQLRNLKGSLDELLRRNKQDLADLRSNVDSDIRDEISLVKQESLDFVNNAPTEELSERLASFVTSRVDSAMRSISNKAIDRIDGMLTKAANELTSISKKAGGDFIDIEAMPEVSIKGKVRLSNPFDDDNASSRTAKIRNLSMVTGSGVLVMHLINPLAGIATALIALRIYNGDIENKKTTGRKRECTSMVERFIQEYQNQCLAELSKVYRTISKEITDELELLCKSIWDEARANLGKGSSQAESNRTRITELNGFQIEMQRLISAADLEITQYQTLLQVEDILGDKK